MAICSRIEPVLPPEGKAELEDLAFELVSAASSLAGQLNPTVREAVGDLVRSMNCYYSNLIEGHNTLPRDIERALAREYSAEPRKRHLQLEAVAHIEVQRKIDSGEEERAEPVSVEHIRWLHYEFCSRLPEDLLWVENPDTGERLRHPWRNSVAGSEGGKAYSTHGTRPRSLSPALPGGVHRADG